MQRFVKNGKVSKITAQFPSTTAVEVTTMNSGLNVGESGVYEWFYYEPKLDSVIAPLLFSFAKDEGRGTLAKDGVNPNSLFPTKTLYEKLSGDGIESHVFISKDYVNSEYNSVLSKGANLYSVKSLAHGLTSLSEVLVNFPKKSYLYFYYGGVDSAGHEYGTTSRYIESEIDVFFTSFEDIFFKYIEGKVDNTAILLSADHGQVDAYPASAFYLNKEIEGIESYLKTTKKGEPIVPAGSCRDMFLHVKEESIGKLSEILENKLGGKAEVYRTEDLIKQGFFGKNLSEEFKSRVGNLVILLYAGESVWWYEKDVFDVHHIGHHGGLTPDEMEIPFLSLSI